MQWVLGLCRYCLVIGLTGPGQPRPTPTNNGWHRGPWAKHIFGCNMGETTTDIWLTYHQFNSKNISGSCTLISALNVYIWLIHPQFFSKHISGSWTFSFALNVYLAQFWSKHISGCYTLSAVHLQGYHKHSITNTTSKQLLRHPSKDRAIAR